MDTALAVTAQAHPTLSAHHGKEGVLPGWEGSSPQLIHMMASAEAAIGFWGVDTCLLETRLRP